MLQVLKKERKKAKPNYFLLDNSPITITPIQKKIIPKKSRTIFNQNYTNIKVNMSHGCKRENSWLGNHGCCVCFDETDSFKSFKKGNNF